VNSYELPEPARAQWCDSVDPIEGYDDDGAPIYGSCEIVVEFDADTLVPLNETEERALDMLVDHGQATIVEDP